MNIKENKHVPRINKYRPVSLWKSLKYLWQMKNVRKEKNNHGQFQPYGAWMHYLGTHFMKKGHLIFFLFMFIRNCLLFWNLRAVYWETTISDLLLHWSSFRVFFILKFFLPGWIYFNTGDFLQVPLVCAPKSISLVENFISFRMC